MNLIDGKKIAAEQRSELKVEVDGIKKKFNKVPGLTVILVGDLAPSQIYVRNKEKSAKEIGLKSEIIKYPKDIQEISVLNKIDELNNDETVSGILVQLPLPDHIDKQKIIERINPDKDVDGFNSKNIGLLALGRPNVIPCTPLGCYFMLDHFTTLKGKNVRHHHFPSNRNGDRTTIVDTNCRTAESEGVATSSIELINEEFLFEENDDDKKIDIKIYIFYCSV